MKKLYFSCKNHLHSYFCSSIIFILLTGCAKTDFDAVSVPKQKFMDPQLSSMLETRSQISESDLKRKREVSVILSEFLFLDHEAEQYYLDISKKDAQGLGITSSEYEVALNEVETANKSILQLKKAGERYTLTDVQTVREKYNDPKNHITITGKSNNNTR